MSQLKILGYVWDGFVIKSTSFIVPISYCFVFSAEPPHIRLRIHQARKQLPKKLPVLSSLLQISYVNITRLPYESIHYYKHLQLKCRVYIDHHIYKGGLKVRNCRSISTSSSR